MTVRKWILTEAKTKSITVQQTCVKNGAVFMFVIGVSNYSRNQTYFLTILFHFFCSRSLAVVYPMLNNY